MGWAVGSGGVVERFGWVLGCWGGIGNVKALAVKTLWLQEVVRERRRLIK